MSILAYLILLAVTGLIVGALARLALPGRDPMTIPQTVLLGLAGNFTAGLVVWLVWRRGVPGLVLSVACSRFTLYFVRRSRGGGPSPNRRRAPAQRYGRLRPSRSCDFTHSSATIAEPSESSPHSTVAATISASLRTLPAP
jgi:uncharacterized membrane protein YeaQ/YmgE (transglycosylase-associated protein family)